MMELLEGESLKHWLALSPVPGAPPNGSKSALPFTVLLDLAIHIADALQAGHSKEIADVTSSRRRCGNREPLLDVRRFEGELDA